MYMTAHDWMDWVKWRKTSITMLVVQVEALTGHILKKMKVRDITAWAGFKKIKPKQSTIPCRESPVQSIICVRSKLTSSSISTHNSIQYIKKLKVTKLWDNSTDERTNLFCVQCLDISQIYNSLLISEYYSGFPWIVTLVRPNLTDRSAARTHLRHIDI
jgi:Ulp1 family protease